MIGMSFNQLDAPTESLPYFMTAAELDKNQDASSISIWSGTMSFRNV